MLSSIGRSLETFGNVADNADVSTVAFQRANRSVETAADPASSMNRVYDNPLYEADLANNSDFASSDYDLNSDPGFVIDRRNQEGSGRPLGEDTSDVKAPSTSLTASENWAGSDDWSLTDDINGMPVTTPYSGITNNTEIQRALRPNTEELGSAIPVEKGNRFTAANVASASLYGLAGGTVLTLAGIGAYGLAARD